MEFIAGCEMDAGDLVDHISKEVAATHTVVHALKNGGDDITPVVTIRAGELSEIGKEPRTSFPVRANRFVLIDEGEEFVPGDPLGFSSQSRQR